MYIHSISITSGLFSFYKKKHELTKESKYNSGGTISFGPSLLGLGWPPLPAESAIITLQIYTKYNLFTIGTTTQSAPARSSPAPADIHN